MIALLDYGSGNLRSVEKALKKVGADVRVSREPKGMNDATAVVLPGRRRVRRLHQRAAKAGIARRRRTNSFKRANRFSEFASGIRRCSRKATSSTAARRGLAFFRAKCVRFSEQPGLKIPQIGWNQLRICAAELPALSRASRKAATFISCTAFFREPTDDSIVATRTTYGETLRVVRLEGQCFRHPISSGEKPEDRTSAFEEFRRAGEMTLNSPASRKSAKFSPLCVPEAALLG